MKVIPLLTAALSTSLVLGACSSRVPAAVPTSSVDPITFFLGRTHGDAELHKLFGSAAIVRVDGVGRKDGDTFILDQVTRVGSAGPKSRRWTLREVGDHRYAGSLSDATGPVTITAQAGQAIVRYKMKGNLDVRQQLVVQSDGRTMSNSLAVSKFGIRVATLRETIHKIN